MYWYDGGYEPNNRFEMGVGRLMPNDRVILRDNFGNALPITIRTLGCDGVF